MKKVEAYVAIYEALKNGSKASGEAFEVFEKDVLRMQEKENAAREESAAKAEARAEVLAEVIDILKDNGKAMACKDIVAELGGDYTPQKLSYVLKEGVANGKLKRVEEGRNIYYTV